LDLAALWVTVDATALYAPRHRTGCQFFAVNGAGPARWQAFPDIIADDGFVLWNFAPEERVEVDGSYSGYYWSRGFLSLSVSGAGKILAKYNCGAAARTSVARPDNAGLIFHLCSCSDYGTAERAI
jgi:hypothetical protein